MTDLERWHQTRADCGWSMPSAPFWKRLPVVRHIRTWWGMYQISRWYSQGPGLLGIPTGYDNWVLFGMWHGLELPAGRAALKGGA